MNFDLSAYRDDFKDQMTRLIEAKVHGKQVVAPPAVEKEEPQVINLMDAMKNSFEKARASAKPSKISASSIAAARNTRKRKSS